MNQRDWSLNTLRWILYDRMLDARLVDDLERIDADHIPRMSGLSSSIEGIARAYGLALLSVLGALAVALLIDPHLPGVPLAVFLIAVALSAWHGGLGPGLAATAISTLLIDYYLESPYASFHITSPETAVDLVLFLAAAVVISTFSNSLRRARMHAERAWLAAEKSQRQAEFVAEFGRILGASLEYEVVLQTIVRLLVPRIADWGAIDLKRSDGTLERAVASPESPGREPSQSETSDVENIQSVVDRVVRSGHTERNGRITCVPLPGRPNPIGVLTLALSTQAEPDGQVALIQELAAHAAAAIDNARLLRAAHEAGEQRERAAAHVLRLNRIADVLAEGVTLNQVANLVLVEAVSITGAMGGRLHIFDPVEDRPAQVAVVGAWVRQAASIGVPMTLKDRTVGVLELVLGDNRVLDDDEAGLLAAMAHQGAQALERARLYEAERKARAAAESANASLRAVQAVTDAALVHLDLDDLLNELLGRVQELLHVDLAAVLIVSDDGQDLVEFASVGALATANRGARVPIGHGVCGRIAHTREPRLVENLSNADVVSPVLRESGVRSFLGVPLVADAALVGVLHVDSVAPRCFSAEDTHLLGVVADRLALGVSQARLYQAERVARAQAEHLAAEQAAVLAQIADGVIIADSAGRISFVNEAASRFLGAAEQLAKSAESSSEYIPEQVLSGFLQHALEGEHQVVDLEVRGAQERVALGRAVPVRGENGARVGAVLTLRDVTAERTLEHRRNEFLSNVSHDLRTPVATIKGAAEVVLQNEPAGVPDSLHRMLEIINDEADRMSVLVDDLLELTRLTTGHVILQREPTDVRRLVNRVARSIEPLVAANNQRVVIDMPRSPIRAYVDASRLERAVQNVLSNAQKYGRPGGAIAVQLHRDSDNIYIAVRDDGPGIPETDLERVFDRFYRSREAARSKIRGSGLGLPIARAMVELHGGRILVDSKLGQGSTFTVVLPAGLPVDLISVQASHEDSDR